MRGERGASLVEVVISMLLLAMMTAPIMSTVLTGSLSSKRADRRLSAASSVRAVSENLKAYVTADPSLVQGAGAGPDGWTLPGDRSNLYALAPGHHELDPVRWAPGLNGFGATISYDVTVRTTNSGPEPDVVFNVAWTEP